MDKNRILVVDDDQNFADSLSDLLIEMGYEVEMANEAAGAIRQVESDGFSLVLMDVKMPRLSGVDTLRLIRENDVQLPVLMMTAFTEKHQIEDAMDEGICGWITKPIDSVKLKNSIDVAMKGGLRVLVVDDDKNFRESLADLLDMEGCFVTSASNGEEAVKMTNRFRQDLALVDMKLPDFNGLWIYLALRKINPAMSIVVMTGFRREMELEVEKALKEGADACLYKPFEKEELMHIVRAAIKMQWERREKADE